MIFGFQPSCAMDAFIPRFGQDHIPLIPGQLPWSFQRDLFLVSDLVFRFNNLRRWVICGKLHASFVNYFSFVMPLLLVCQYLG